jgi:hypothetical protein
MPVPGIHLGDHKSQQSKTSQPVHNGVSRPRQSYSYERTVQNILADREGRKTWPELEDLEKRAVTCSQARRAMFRLETLNATNEFAATDQKGPAPERLAKLLDRSDGKTERQGWNKLLASGPVSQTMPVLKASGKKTGWRILGYPPCVGKKIGPASRAMEEPERWNSLVTSALKKRLRPGNDDPRLEEYRRLHEAHEKVSSGKVRGRVSERSLYLDMKALEDELLPEHLDKAKGEAKTRILGGSEHEGFQPESRVRRFIGALSALPENSRERHMFLELSRVATRDPNELRRYAAHVLEELKGCNASLCDQLLPDFRKALARVSRLQSDRKIEKRRLGSTDSFQNLLSALNGPKNGNGSQENSGELKLYRSGLTVNGTSRDYTY